MRAYDKAYELKLRDKDAMMHVWFGEYGISALMVSIEHCLAKNPKSKYVDKPLYERTSNVERKGQEEIAVFEMKQRMNMLTKTSLPESPI